MAKSNLTGVKFSRISLVDKGASLDSATGDGAHVLLYKRATPADEDNTMTPEELAQRVKELETENASLKKATTAPATAEDILKSADPAVRALVEKAQADAKAASEEAAVTKAAVEKLTKAARMTDLRKRVDAFPSLSGDAEVLAKVLGCIEDGEGAETAKAFEETLKGWNAQIEKGGVMSKGIGSRGTTEGSDPGSAVEEANRLAAEVVTKSAGKVDHSTAISQVFETNPDLYARHVAETAGRGTKQ